MQSTDSMGMRVFELLFTLLKFPALLFAVVMVSGLLSSLISLGALELFLRRRINRNTILRYIEDAVPNSRSVSSDFISYLKARYENTPTNQEYILNYMYTEKSRYLGRTSLIRGNIIYLLGLDDGVFELSYRQICGQLLSIVNNEAVRYTEIKSATPLIDLFELIRIQRRISIFEDNKASDVLSLTSDEPSFDEAFRASDVSIRSVVDTAMREIDVIQAKLGSSVSMTIFPVNVTVWLIIYVFVALTTIFGFKFTDYTIIQSSFYYLILFIFSIVTSFLLALASAVFSVVVINWLDSIIASR